VTQTVSNAVEQRKASPAELIRKYSTDFATVLPSHVNAATWVRLAEGALRKGKRIENERDPNHGRFELEVAAGNNPGAFMAALLDAARQGLEPGSEQYYLTPRKVKGRLEILGIVGYQGYVELMYRGGAVTSVIAEVVRETDYYRYDRGIDTVPIHKFKPFARDADRGRIIGTYAYARMHTGDVSKIVELNLDDLQKIRDVNPASGSDYSPWVKWESEMVLKSGARRLRKWVPTSNEYRMELARAAAAAQQVAAAPHVPAGADTPQGDAAFIDGDFEETGGTEWPPVPTPGGEQ
jgi:recombination protein RecT